MRKGIMCALLVLVMVNVSSAFGNVTDDLLKAVRYENTTPKEIQTLINSGADVNAKGIFDMTALMCAATVNSKPEVTRILLNAGADIFAKDNSGKTVLDYAQTDAIKRLILDYAQ